jgi:D-alanyl-D-alanine dipeptidase
MAGMAKVSSMGFVLEPRYWFFGWTRTPRLRLRRAVAAQLAEARSALPKGWNFKVWDGYRTYTTQVRMIESFRKRLICANPHLTEAQREALVWRYAAKPKRHVTRPDSHRTGGAVDLTLVDAAGRELDMGTDHDALVPEAALAFYERKAHLTLRERRVRDNRRILVRAMTRAGFERYPPEWWHWGSLAE